MDRRIRNLTKFVLKLDNQVQVKRGKRKLSSTFFKPRNQFFFSMEMRTNIAGGKKEKKNLEGKSVYQA
jgi:hypothetical protein